MDSINQKEGEGLSSYSSNEVTETETNASMLVGPDKNMTLEEAFDEAMKKKAAAKKKKKSPTSLAMSDTDLKAEASRSNTNSENSSEDSKKEELLKKLAKIEEVAAKKHGDLSLQELLDAPKSPIFEVRIRQAEVLRLAGNDAFSKGDLQSAVKLYETSLFHSDFAEAQVSFEFQAVHQAAIAKSRVPVYLNLARVAQKQSDHRKALGYISKIEVGDSTGLRVYKKPKPDDGGENESVAAKIKPSKMSMSSLLDSSHEEADRLLFNAAAIEVSDEYLSKAIFLKAKSLFFIGQLDSSLVLFEGLAIRVANKDSNKKSNNNNISNNYNNNNINNSDNSNTNTSISAGDAPSGESNGSGDNLDAIQAWIKKVKLEDLRAKAKEKALFSGVFNKPDAVNISPEGLSPNTNPSHSSHSNVLEASQNDIVKSTPRRLSAYLLVLVAIIALGIGVYIKLRQ